MAKKRMAGEELERDNPVAAEAKNAVVEKVDKNYEARERIAASPERSEERLGQIDSKYDLDGFSDKEVIMSFKGGAFDDNDYERLTGKSATPETDSEVGIPTPPPATNPSPPQENPIAPLPPMRPGIGSTNQTVNQDNDINSNVTGDNNVVDINQDNSVRQSAGYAMDYHQQNDRAELEATNLMDNYVLNLRKSKATG